MTVIFDKTTDDRRPKASQDGKDARTTDDPKERMATLHEAVEADDVSRVRTLVDAGADIEERNDADRTPLQRAAEMGIVAMAQCLIALGAADDDDFTPLLLAVFEGHEAMVECLLEQGCDADHVTITGDSALHVAAFHNGYMIALLLLRAGARLDIQNNNGALPLYIALEEEHDDIFHLITAEGVRRRYSPLHKAVAAGDLLEVQALVDAGADIEEICKMMDDDYYEEYDATPLYHAATLGCMMLALYLVKRGANKEATAYMDGTPLHTVAAKGDIETVRMLIVHEANKEATDVAGSTPLMEASCKGHVAVVGYLLEQGCDVNHADDEYDTSLHRAAGDGHHDVVLTLIRYGAKLDMENINGDLAADVADRNGHKEIADFIRVEKRGWIAGWRCSWR